MSKDGWRAVKDLQPGDACEFRRENRQEWLPGTVVENGGVWYWRIRGDSGEEGQRGAEAAVPIECVRIPVCPDEEVGDAVAADAMHRFSDSVSKQTIGAAKAACDAREILESKKGRSC